MDVCSRAKHPLKKKHPVLLKWCGVVDQLILHVREQMQHRGASFVISELRCQDVWILQPKKSVSSVNHTCRRCCRFIAAPAAEVVAPFPHSRVSSLEPLTLLAWILVDCYFLEMDPWCGLYFLLACQYVLFTLNTLNTLNLYQPSWKRHWCLRCNGLCPGEVQERSYEEVYYKWSWKKFFVIIIQSVNLFVHKKHKMTMK